MGKIKNVAESIRQKAGQIKASRDEKATETWRQEEAGRVRENIAMNLARAEADCVMVSQEVLEAASEIRLLLQNNLNNSELFEQVFEWANGLVEKHERGLAYRKECEEDEELSESPESFPEEQSNRVLTAEELDDLWNAPVNMTLYRKIMAEGKQAEAQKRSENEKWLRKNPDSSGGMHDAQRKIETVIRYGNILKNNDLRKSETAYRAVQDILAEINRLAKVNESENRKDGTWASNAAYRVIDKDNRLKAKNNAGVGL